MNDDGDDETVDDVDDPDEVVYPEEVDKTVQSTEDEQREDTADNTVTPPIVLNASTVDVLDDPNDRSPGATDSDDRPGLIWIRRAAPGSHLIDHDGLPATPLQRETFADADTTVTPNVVATTPTKSAVANAFVDVSRPYWVVNDDGTPDAYVVRRQQVAGPLDSVSSSFRPLQTRRNGTYRVGYSYIGTSAQTETIIPSVIRIERRGSLLDPDRATVGVQPLTVGGLPASVLTYVIDQIRQGEALDSADATSNALSSVLTTDDRLGVDQAEEVADDPVSIYWAKEGNSSQSNATRRGGDPEPVSIRVRDVANRAIVVNEPLAEDDEDNPMVYYYDEDDNFSIEGVGVTFEMFEEALSKTWKDDELYAYSVEWENYTTSRPGRISRTIWELGLSCSAPPDDEAYPGMAYATTTS